MNEDISKEMPRILATAGSGIIGGAIGFVLGRAGFPSDIPHVVGASIVAGVAGAAVVDAAMLAVKKVREVKAERHSDIWEDADAAAEEFREGFEEGFKDGEKEPKLDLEVYHERERLFPEEYSKPPLTDYTKFRKGHHEKEPGEDSEKKPIFQITKEEYLSMANKDYTKADGTYFAADGILAGWNDKLDVKDPFDTIGEEAVSILTEEDVDGVYVRNDILKVDYQITKSESSYDEAVAELRDYDIPFEEV